MITIAEKTEQGVPARHPEDVYRFIEVNLGSIKYTPPTHHMKKGVKKAYSPEDIHMMSSAQPASHGNYVKNEYFIAVRTEYDGCTCCSSIPIARIPFVITPTVNPACYGFQPPADY